MGIKRPLAGPQTLPCRGEARRCSSYRCIAAGGRRGCWFVVRNQRLLHPYAIYVCGYTGLVWTYRPPPRLCESVCNIDGVDLRFDLFCSPVSVCVFSALYAPLVPPLPRRQLPQPSGFVVLFPP